MSDTTTASKYLTIFSKFDFFDYVSIDYSTRELKDYVCDMEGLLELAEEFLIDMATLFCLQDDVPNAKELVDALIEYKNWFLE